MNIAFSSALSIAKVKQKFISSLSFFWKSYFHSYFCPKSTFISAIEGFIQIVPFSFDDDLYDNLTLTRFPFLKGTIVDIPGGLINIDSDTLSS